MEIRVISTGSKKGNAYLVMNGYHRLLIECGVPFRALVKGLWNMGLTISRLDACLISHAHKDHYHCVGELLYRGIDCYMSTECAEKLEIQDNSRVRQITNMRPFIIGDNRWEIVPFPAEHDIPCLGFYIRNSNNNLLYLSDSAYTRYVYPNLTHIMIGVNYDSEIIKQNVESGEVNKELRNRIINSHASLQTVMEMLKANDKSNLEEVWLLHLSDVNSNEEDFVQRIGEIVNCPVYVAGRQYDRL